MGAKPLGKDKKVASSTFGLVGGWGRGQKPQK